MHAVLGHARCIPAGAAVEPLFPPPPSHLAEPHCQRPEGVPTPAAAAAVAPAKQKGGPSHDDNAGQRGRQREPDAAGVRLAQEAGRQQGYDDRGEAGQDRGVGQRQQLDGPEHSTDDGKAQQAAGEEQQPPAGGTEGRGEAMHSRLLGWGRRLLNRQAAFMEYDRRCCTRLLLRSGLMPCQASTAAVADRRTSRLPRMKAKGITPSCPSFLPQLPMTTPKSVLSSCSARPSGSPRRAQPPTRAGSMGWAALQAPQLKPGLPGSCKACGYSALVKRQACSHTWNALIVECTPSLPSAQ